MKSFYHFLVVALAFLFVVSCEGVKNESKLDESPVIDPVDPETEVLDAESQGARLSETAIKFIEEIDADKFTSAVDLIEALQETDLEEYENEDNEAIIENFIQKVLTCTEESAGLDRWLYSLSDVRGKYVAAKGKITVSKSSDFELFLEDDYHLKASFSEKSNHVLVTADRQLSYPSYGSPSQSHDDYYYADVPEEIDLMLQYKGDELLKIVMKSSFNLHASFEDFDARQDAFAISISVDLCGYTFTLNKANYESGTAQLIFAFYKGEKCLLSEKAIVNGIKFVGEQFTNVDDVSLELDILGMVQITVKSPDAMAVVDCVERIEDIKSKTDADNVAKSLNANISAQVFYGSKTPQAVLGFEPMTIDSKQTQWSVVPVIIIGDQSYEISDYSKILSDSKIDRIVSAFEHMCSDFEKLVE